MKTQLMSLCTGLNRDAMAAQIGSFPLDVFPVQMQRLVLDLVRQENYPLDFTVVAMLSAAASAIGNACQIRVKGRWITSPILYVILVGNPGVGKTPPLDFAYTPLQERDARRYAQHMEKLKEYEQNKGNEKEAEKPLLIRSLISDFTPEAMIHAHHANLRGITIYVDEIMGMFGSMNRYAQGQLAEQLLTAHSAKPLNVSRCNLPLPFHIHKPCIHIVGTTQTYRIGELLNMGFLQNGMMDRILFAYAPNRKIEHWRRDVVVNDNADCQWDRVIERLCNLPCEENTVSHMVTSRILPMSSDAVDLFYNWRNTLIDSINDCHDDTQRETRFAKEPLHVARIALVIQLLRWAFEEGEMNDVDIQSVEAAIRMNDYFTECYRELVQIMKSEAMDVLERDWLCELPSNFTTAEAIVEGEKVGMAHRSVNRALSRMVADGMLRKIKKGFYSKLS